jgi:hypothetical protein
VSKFEKILLVPTQKERLLKENSNKELKSKIYPEKYF